MDDHDPLCLRWQERDGTYECRCDMVTEARADERERIAQAIEAYGNRPQGAHWQRVAAQIARGGGDDRP